MLLLKRNEEDYNQISCHILTINGITGVNVQEI